MVLTMTMTAGERGRMIETIARLNRDVSEKQQALIEARVMLGHVVRTLRARYDAADVEAVIEAANVHRRRLSEAVRLAEHFANDDGSVAWERYRAMLTAKGHADRSGAPSVRSMIGLVKRVPVVEEVEQPVEVPGSDDEDLVLAGVGVGPDADAEFDEGMVLQDVPGEDPDHAAEGEAAYLRTLEPAGLEAAAARVIGQGVRGAAKAWAVGPQMTLEGMYERATGLADDLERMLDRCGIADAAALLDPIRVRLGSVSSNVR